MERPQSFTETPLVRCFLLCLCAIYAGLAAAGEEPRQAQSASAPVAAERKHIAKEMAPGRVPAKPGNISGPQAQIQELSRAVELLTERLDAATASQEDREKKLAEQQAQIEKLTRAVELLTERLNAGVPSAAQSAANQAAARAPVGVVSSLAPVIPAAAVASLPALSVAPLPAAAPATVAQVEAYTQKVDALDKTVGVLNRGLAGFKFSGDLRFRTDLIFRSGNSVAGPQQNVRERYRVRLNVNKEVADQFGFHLQLGTGTSNNPTTYDSDFTGFDTRGFLWLSQYYGDYHPNKNFSVRAGKMEEVFFDGQKFTFDDDIEFNGIHEIAKVPLGDNASVEFRAGQYVFSNPNVQVLPSAAACAGANPPAACAFEKAGYAPGGKVRDANLFHQGAVVTAKTGDRWRHQFTADVQLYRNPNQFLMASSSGNLALLVNGYTGLTLSGGVGQLGNGTTTPGGFIYTASSYHVGHIGYHVDYAGWKTSRESWPLSLDVQAARNFGGSFLNNAWVGILSVGRVKKAGDLRFLYGYYVKEANSMIAQVTDDDIGTGVSVNTRTHYIRVDLGVTKYLQWQNLLYIQNEISGNDPARNFYVPSLARGARTQYRVHSQFAISF
jgi:uncharacterized coiled-coil protein SlyX